MVIAGLFLCVYRGFNLVILKSKVSSHPIAIQNRNIASFNMTNFLVLNILAIDFGKAFINFHFSLSKFEYIL